MSSDEENQVDDDDDEPTVCLFDSTSESEEEEEEENNSSTKPRQRKVRFAESQTDNDAIHDNGDVEESDDIVDKKVALC